MSEPHVGAEVLSALAAWSPWIWSGSSAIGIVICVRLWSVIRAARKRYAWRDLDHDDGFLVTLIYFERLAITSAAFLLAMFTIGISSVILEGNVWNGIATLCVLLVLPPAITWIVFRAFRLRLTS